VDDNRFLKIGVGVIAVFLFGFFLKLAKPVLVPFLMALLLSFALTPVLDFLVRRKIPKSVALVGILLFTFLVMYLIGVLFYSSGKTLAAELPSYDDMLKSTLERIDHSIHNVRLKADLMTWIQGLNADKVRAVILSALGTFFSFMEELLLILVFTIFILAERGRLETKIVKALSPERASAVSRTVLRIDRQIQKYLAVQTLINLCLGILVTVITTLFGLPFPLVFGVLTFIFQYIPNLGSVVVTALPVLLAAFYFPTLGKAVALLFILGIVHFVLGNIFGPRLMGKGLGLSPLLVFFSLIFGAWLWGIEGMILAVPILAVFKIIFSNIPSLRFLEDLMDM
jgi:predicted PurR-regulated permease PerM